MKAYKFLLTVAIAFLPAMVFAQTGPDSSSVGTNEKKIYSDAEAHWEDERYEQALPLYEFLVTKHPDNANFRYKLGTCYLKAASNHERAIPHFEYAIKNYALDAAVSHYKEKRAPVDVLFRLAEAYHTDYQLDSAIVYFEKFKKFVQPTATELMRDVNRRIGWCNNAKEVMQNPVQFEVENLGPNINSPFEDYAAVLSADEATIIFTSRRPDTQGGQKDPNINQYFDDLYISHKINGEWTIAEGMGSPINSNFHEASISISVDGSKLFIYKDERGNGNIFESELIGDTWTAPIKMGPNINSDYIETHAVISADGNTIYFTSDRPGGLGGLDIYRSKKLPNGEWSFAQNLGPSVNTAFDDDAPFIHPDGVTLFFISEGHKSMGYFDIFYSKYNEEDNTWSEPANIGYPINTPDDELFYVLSPDGKRAYYSAVKNSGFGESDIYLIHPEDSPETQPVTVLKGRLTVADGGDIPPSTQIVVTDNETEELIGVYKVNPKTGKYLFILPPGKNYNVRYEADGYLFHSENLFVPEGTPYSEIEKAINLPTLEIGQIITLRNIFFEFGSATLAEESKVELDKLYDLLVANEKLVVAVVGHTDGKGSDDGNLKLSQNRAESVVKYITDKGIVKTRLKPVGKGKTEPIAINQNPDGSWNEEGMALNRRIELKILGTDGEIPVEEIAVPEDLKVGGGGGGNE